MRTFMHKWTCVFISLGFIPRRGISESYRNSTLNLLRKCQIGFHSSIQFYIPPVVCIGFWFLHISPNTFYYSFIFNLIVNFLKDFIFFKSSFRLLKLRGKYNFPYIPCPHICIASSIVNIFHQRGLLVTINKPTLSWCYPFKHKSF